MIENMSRVVTVIRKILETCIHMPPGTSSRKFSSHPTTLYALFLILVASTTSLIQMPALTMMHHGCQSISARCISKIDIVCNVKIVAEIFWSHKGKDHYIGEDATHEDALWMN